MCEALKKTQSLETTLEYFVLLPRTKRVKEHEFCSITQPNLKFLFNTFCKLLLRFFILKLEFDFLHQTDPVATCTKVEMY